MSHWNTLDDKTILLFSSTIWQYIRRQDDTFIYLNDAHTLVLPFSMPGKAAVSALLNSPLGLWVSLKIKDFKYILHDLVSKINIKFEKKYIYRKERKIFVHFIVSKTYSKLLRLHMPRFLLKKAKPGYDDEHDEWIFIQLRLVVSKMILPYKRLIMNNWNNE